MTKHLHNFTELSQKNIMSIQRREFLKKVSIATGGLMLTGISTSLIGCASSKVNSAVNNNFGLQLAFYLFE